MSRQTIEVTKAHPAITAVAPSGAAGLEIGFLGQLKARKYIITASVTTADEDVFLYVQMADGDTDDTNDRANGTWHLYNDKHGRYIAGKLNSGSKIVAGTNQAFIVEDLGPFIGVCIVKGGAVGAVVAATVSPVTEGTRAG